MAWSTLEQLKALTAKITPAQREAMRREYQSLCEKYPGQNVAYIDEWNGEELVRTVLVATVDCVDFHAQIAKLSPEVLAKLQQTLIPDPYFVDAPSVWLE
jgi:hypothetical protein